MINQDKLTMMHYLTKTSTKKMLEMFLKMLTKKLPTMMWKILQDLKLDADAIGRRLLKSNAKKKGVRYLFIMCVKVHLRINTNLRTNLPKKCIIHHPNSLFSTTKKPDYHPSSHDDAQDNNITELTPHHEGYVKSSKERALEHTWQNNMQNNRKMSAKPVENYLSDWQFHIEDKSTC